MNIFINFMLVIPKLGIILLVVLGLVWFGVCLIDKTFNQPSDTLVIKQVIPPLASFIAAVSLTYALFSPILGPKTSQEPLEDVVIEETYQPSQKAGEAPVAASKPVLQLDYKLRYKEILEK